MMLVLMPIAGAGYFGLNRGIGAPIATFILHLVYRETIPADAEEDG
jgi:hypothetical protein